MAPARLGIMGGTFDPIHFGHLVAAEEALVHFNLDRVIFMPTGRPAFKEDAAVSSAEHRYLMTVLATTANPDFDVSRLEIERPGLTYTVDTLLALHEQYGPSTELFFITGADAVWDIVSWKDADKIAGLTTFIAATRPGLRPGCRGEGARGGRDAVPHRVPRGARARHLVDRHPRAGGRAPADPLPHSRAGLRLHREVRALPRGRQVTVDFDAIERALAARLSDAAFAHSVRTAETAENLAAVYGVDPELARVAGLLHDWDREASHRGASVDRTRRTAMSTRSSWRSRSCSTRAPARTPCARRSRTCLPRSTRRSRSTPWGRWT